MVVLVLSSIPSFFLLTLSISLRAHKPHIRFRVLLFCLDHSSCFLLHIFHCFGSFSVDVTFDFPSFGLVFKIEQEFVELVEAFSEVLDWDLPIIIEVQSEPIIFDHYLDIFIMGSHVINHFLLVLLEDLDEGWYPLHCNVVHHIQIFSERIVHSVVEVLIKFCTFFLSLLYLFGKFNVPINVGIRSALLNIVDSLLA